MINALEEKALRLNQYPCINVGFALSGKQLPADHGYLLYSAISKATQRGSSPTVREGSVDSNIALHKTDWLAVELISGFALRYRFQLEDMETNRTYHLNSGGQSFIEFIDDRWADWSPEGDVFVDDDLLGFMNPEAAKAEREAQIEAGGDEQPKAAPKAKKEKA